MVDFTFVPQDSPDGRSRRLRNRTACQPCRLRKRRCHHQLRPRVSESDAMEGALGPPERNGPRTSGSVPHMRQRREVMAGNPGTASHLLRGSGSLGQGRMTPDASLLSSSTRDAQPSTHVEFNGAESDVSPRFVGDLLPEAGLIDGSTPSHDVKHTSAKKVAGVWVSRRSPHNMSDTPRTTPARGFDQLPQDSSDLIGSHDLSALVNLYFADINPIIPALNEQEFRLSLTRNSVPPPLIHVVCLLAAKHHAAAPYMRLLPLTEGAVSVRTFCSRLYESITSAVSGKTSIKKIALVRILGLLSLHHEGRDGAEESSLHIAQAIHHAQTLGIHLDRPSDEGSEMKRLWWCLWTLDRLNSVINSRPCVANDVDIAVDHLTPGESGSVAFDMWFRISKMLSIAVGLYRPSNPPDRTEVDLECYGFEQLVDDTQGWSLPSSTLATLRIFFFSASIIAHRLKTIKTSSSFTAARLRQYLASIQIIRYMQDDNRRELLHPLPVVVHAASLALSVFYQYLRYSRLSIEQEEARQDFNTACGILRALQRKWSAADAMASLAQRVSDQLDKVPNVAVLQVDREAINGGHNRDAVGQTNQASGSITNETTAAGLMSNPDAAEDQQGGQQVFTWQPDGFDLFGGMDDMSWMYLDPQNPIMFDRLPITDWDTVFSEP